jgi:proteic killer suppression protein
MQLVLSNAQGELSPLERGMHALAATDIKAYALAVGRKPATVQGEVQAARVAKNGQPFLGDLLERTNQLVAIHCAPQPCWLALVRRLVDDKWNREQTIAAVKTVLAVKPPRGYEKLFAIENLQEMAAGGQDPTEVTPPGSPRQYIPVDPFRISIYAMDVISSFKDSETERIFQGLRSRSFEAIAKTAYRKLAILHSARTLYDLKSPGLLLEALKDDRAGQHSIRINDRYRVCFEWRDGEASNVEIVDYH